jgi:archaellum component FlaG (FlaF/FlaG flagellin family)
MSNTTAKMSNTTAKMSNTTAKMSNTTDVEYVYFGYNDTEDYMTRQAAEERFAASPRSVSIFVYGSDSEREYLKVKDHTGKVTLSDNSDAVKKDLYIEMWSKLAEHKVIVPLERKLELYGLNLAGFEAEVKEYGPSAFEDGTVVWFKDSIQDGIDWALIFGELESLFLEARNA